MLTVNYRRLALGRKEAQAKGRGTFSLSPTVGACASQVLINQNSLKADPEVVAQSVVHTERKGRWSKSSDVKW